MSEWRTCGVGAGGAGEEPICFRNNVPSGGLSLGYLASVGRGPSLAPFLSYSKPLICAFAVLVFFEGAEHSGKWEGEGGDCKKTKRKKILRDKYLRLFHLSSILFQTSRRENCGQFQKLKKSKLLRDIILEQISSGVLRVPTKELSPSALP